MCSYCGCQSLTVVGRFMAEHEAIITTTGLLRRAAERGDRAAAAVTATMLKEMLEPHTQAEERSLFAELRLDPEFTDIDREDNGLFPAAAIALGGPAWERVVERAG